MPEELEEKNISQDLDKWLSIITNAGKSVPERELKEDKKATLKEEEHAIKNNGLKQQQQLRESIFDWVKIVVVCYLVFIAVIICSSLPLTENVLITLLTTTTINVLGLPALIIHSLFPKNKKEKKDKK